MKKLLIFAVLAVMCSCTAKYGESEIAFKVWYDRQLTSLPDFSTLGEPDTTGIMTNLSLGDCVEPSKDHYAAEFTSVLSVPEDEEYTFILSCDDGARLYVDGDMLIDLSDAHGDGATEKASLRRGKHNLKIEYYEDCGGQYVDFLIGSSGELPHAYNCECPFDGTPEFVMEQAGETYARFEQWKGDDEAVVFPIITDVHTQMLYTYMHIGFLAQADSLFNYDFMVSLGDIGLNLGPGHYSKDYVKGIIEVTRREMDKFDGVFLYAAGNHDWDAGEGDYHTQQFLSDTFQKPALEHAGGNLHLTPGKVYCYYDLPEKNVRVILLNSEGTGTRNGCYYIFDDEQVEWLRKLLDATPEDMSIVLMSHYMPHPIGRWHNTPVPVTLASNERMMSILSEYHGKRRIVGLFCGDSHVNAHEVKDGVNYYITQSYGWCSDDLMMDGTKHAYFDYRKSLCCDVVAIKPQKGEVHTFRIGAGGPDYDYEFSY